MHSFPSNLENCYIFYFYQVSLRDGYQPTKKTELLKVAKSKSKPKPNILDKMPAKKQLSGGSKDSTPSPPASPSPHVTAVNAVLTQRVDELSSELHKMKAIILKHEVRIRDLEKKVEHGFNDTNNIQNNETNNNGETATLLPDEV